MMKPLGLGVDKIAALLTWQLKMSLACDDVGALPRLPPARPRATTFDYTTTQHPHQPVTVSYFQYPPSR